eukprot:3456971-Rhodomonas_salina.1
MGDRSTVPLVRSGGSSIREPRSSMLCPYRTLLEPAPAYASAVPAYASAYRTARRRVAARAISVLCVWSTDLISPCSTEGGQVAVSAAPVDNGALVLQTHVNRQAITGLTEHRYALRSAASGTGIAYGPEEPSQLPLREGT